VKINRNLSSGYSTVSSNNAGSLSGSNLCASYSSSDCLSLLVFSRRTASSSFRWATVVSHAPGFRGVPSLSQFVIAEVRASCNASSAKSKEPERRIKVAMIRPYSSRKTRSSVPLGSGMRRDLHTLLAHATSPHQVKRETQSNNWTRAHIVVNLIGRISTEPSRPQQAVGILLAHSIASAKFSQSSM